MLVHPIDMHRHLGGSIPINTLSNLTGLHKTDVVKQYTIATPISYNKFFEKFKILDSIKWNADVLYNVILDISSEIRNDSIRATLLSVSIDKYLIAGMDISEILDTLLQSKYSAYSEIEFLLAIKYENVKIYENQIKNTDINKFLSIFKGIDFVGNEYLLRDDSFKIDLNKWHEEGKIIRAHVGEYGNEEHIRLAINQLAVNRIAHGICIKDPYLIDKALSSNISFDLCISSNYLSYNVLNL
jgi:adenosine deaminase